MSNSIELGDVSYVTKLAGFEHTKYIQPNATKTKVNADDVPMYIGLNVKDGKLTESIHWYLPRHLSETLHRSALTKKCLVLPYVGSVGDLAVYNDKHRHHLASNVAKIELLESAPFSEEYLYYYLKSPYGQRQLLFYIQGGIQKNITMAAIRKTKVEVQKNSQGIVRVLSALDDKIELNRKINAELEQMARKLYDYWFVQFDFPGSDGKPYKSSGGQMVYNDQLKREIPENWQVQDMHTNDLFEIIKPKINKFSGTKQYIATADVNGLAMTDGTPITYEGRESRANMQPREYTIWFAKMKESVKHIFVGDYSEDLLRDAIFSTGFMGMQTSREAFEYLTLTIHRPYFELVKDANSNGATMAAIGNNDMKNIKLIVPSDDVLRKFHQTVRPILAKTDCNRQQSQKLVELRDWLLPMLMNGQVRVK
jgi:type I restriction enzyme S subunit